MHAQQLPSGYGNVLAVVLPVFTRTMQSQLFGGHLAYQQHVVNHGNGM
jgi:hypothetical protein